MDSLFGRLPEELFLQIVDAAVSMFLIKDRATVVRLCQTSRAVYNHVAPTLYHTIIAKSSNAEAIVEFANDKETAPLAARLFSNTKSLHVIAQIINIPAALLQNVEIIQASFSMAKEIAIVADRLDANAGIPESSPSSCSIRRLYMWYAKYQSIYKLSARTRANVTHICGYVSNSAANRNHADFIKNPETYMRAILDALPGLTHLGFELIYLNDSWSHIVDVWEIGAFERALRAALSYQRLDSIAIRVSGRFITRWDEILRMLLQVSGSDRRLKVWKDDNGATSWDEEEALCARDAAEGRSIWTQVRPVQDI